jgi:hypothetical protein
MVSFAILSFEPAKQGCNTMRGSMILTSAEVFSQTPQVHLESFVSPQSVAIRYKSINNRAKYVILFLTRGQTVPQ